MCIALPSHLVSPKSALPAGSTPFSSENCAQRRYVVSTHYLVGTKMSAYDDMSSPSHMYFDRAKWPYDPLASRLSPLASRLSPLASHYLSHRNLARHNLYSLTLFKVQFFSNLKALHA